MKRSGTKVPKEELDGGTAGEPDFLVSNHDPYPQVQPGEYQLYCNDVRVYRDPGLKVWKCRYRFVHPMREDFPPLYGFINLGRDRTPPGRRSRYYFEWTVANGHLPRKRQVLSPRIFKGKIFVVRVDWVMSRQHDGKKHTSATRYSLVKGIVDLACSGVVDLPSIEVHKSPSKVGSLQEPDTAGLSCSLVQECDTDTRP